MYLSHIFTLLFPLIRVWEIKTKNTLTAFAFLYSIVRDRVLYSKRFYRNIISYINTHIYFHVITAIKSTKKRTIKSLQKCNAKKSPNRCWKTMTKAYVQCSQWTQQIWRRAKQRNRQNPVDNQQQKGRQMHRLCLSPAKPLHSSSYQSDQLTKPKQWPHP